MADYDEDVALLRWEVTEQGTEVVSTCLLEGCRRSKTRGGFYFLFCFGGLVERVEYGGTVSCKLLSQRFLPW